MYTKRELTPFGVAVKKALIDRRMTQQELARRIGTSRQYLDLILFGQRAGTQYVTRIIKALDLRIEDNEKTA
ncbi:helix-turn-helix domain-containing protein [Harryflintia acetispora]|uniref:Helix-turn-helix protein n=1 Tax=Harryflintia acetispora TaxID=1849041 RepID=A0A9X8UJ26_9FIRM|nr:helix-turn-helix transcriptional regulator [Harryflintia acetispora]TCL43196.1 helix-turn-helix protein [Harryflintia acetispora]